MNWWCRQTELPLKGCVWARQVFTRSDVRGLPIISEFLDTLNNSKIQYLIPEVLGNFEMFDDFDHFLIYWSLVPCFPKIHPIL